MILDTSALMAIALDEDGSDIIESKIRKAERLLISAGTLLELRIVVDARKSARASALLDRLLDSPILEVVPTTEAQVELGRGAYRRYGKGSGHPARLNFGDCFAYTLAAETGEPILCTGAEFGHTDVRLA